MEKPPNSEPDARKSRSENKEAFDAAYWQKAGPAAIFEAAAEMVDDFYRAQGIDPATVKFDRTKTRLVRGCDLARDDW